MYIYIYIYSVSACNIVFFFSSAPKSADRKEKLTAVINVLRRPFCCVRRGGDGARSIVLNHLISGRRDPMQTGRENFFDRVSRPAAVTILSPHTGAPNDI